jgi:hypothetical protein
MGGSIDKASSTLGKHKSSQRLGSSTSRRPFLQRRPDVVAPPALQTSPVVDGYGYRERDGEGDDVWEVAGDGVSSMVCSEAPFIGQRREGSGVSSMGLG